MCCSFNSAACWLIVQFNFLLRCKCLFYSNLTLAKSQETGVLIFYLSTVDELISSLYVSFNALHKVQSRKGNGKGEATAQTFSFPSGSYIHMSPQT